MEAISDAIMRLCTNEPVDEDLANRVAAEILSGAATAAQIGAFLVGLAIRGEQAEHLKGFVRAMRSLAKPVTVTSHANLIDTCGTGGDHFCTFNISTAAAIVAAGAGARIAKHGNRAVTSKQGSGSADVLAQLGVNVSCSTETSLRCLEQCGLAFFFAPTYHGAMRHAGPARRELGVRTILNLLGPMTNPAGVRRQVIGVGIAEMTEVFARVLIETKSEHVMVVHGQDGMDEITLTAPTKITEATQQEMKTYLFHPEEHGMALCKLADLQITAENQAEARAEVIQEILAGTDGPWRDITVLNAAAALIVAGVARDWPDGIARARAAIDTRAAEKVLETLVRVSNEEPPEAAG
ncbi:MAG TPA: anthranilate phosphoribosyltransferase [Candidatus Sumerlaeota bacterium]|nr:anthranilate phosphoribosyltransferase [Candidatus Sumerlaeota bacterium]HOR28973.1 anthranilate phosphoribosyltransferase [Candidatus Sumerlaeota bacterium]